MYFQIKSVQNQQNTKHRKYKPDRGGQKVDRNTRQILSVIIFFLAQDYCNFSDYCSLSYLISIKNKNFVKGPHFFFKVKNISFERNFWQILSDDRQKITDLHDVPENRRT